MKTLYLMRHGETLFNVQHKKQGWCDSPLTENGIKQALKAAEWFKDNGIEFDHACCSTSERACDTLEIVVPGMPYTRMKGLKEWNFGAFEGKDECLNPPVPYGDFFKTFGGEGQAEMLDRFSHTLESIMEQEGHENVLVVSHGGVMMNFAYGCMHVERDPKRKHLANCGILVCTYENGNFRLEKIVDPAGATEGK